MKTSKIIQTGVVLTLASGLYLLYLNSKIDNQLHLAITKDILTLKEHDLKLNLSIIQNKNGLHKNFDVISLSQQQTTEALKHLNNNLVTYTDSDLILRTDIMRLGEMEIDKNLLVSHYKQNEAIVSFTKNYLPSLFNEITDIVNNAENIDRDTKYYLKKEINQLKIDVDRYISGYDNDESSLKKRLAHLIHRSNSLLIDSEAITTLLTQYIEKIIDRNSFVQEIVNKIQSIETIDLIDRTQKRYSSLYEGLNNEAIKYKQLLFTSSIALLVYLIVIFTRLQSTSVSLKDTLADLKFRKAALDKHAIVSITDVKGNIVYVNDKFCEISKYSRAELIGHNHRIIKSDEHNEAYFSDMWKTIARGGIWQGEICNRAKDGSLYWVETTLMPRLNKQGKPYEYIGMRTDITNLKNAELEIQSLARFPMENPEPIMRVDKSGIIVFHNDAAERLLQHLNIKIDNLIPDEWLSVVNSTSLDDEIREIETDIDSHHFIIKFTPITEAGYVNIYARDITEKKRAEESLSHQANHDRLTGLLNRYAFEAELSNSLSSAKTHSSQHILLYLDLDQFKIVNDTCGHIAGDELLRQLSHMMPTLFRENDTVARLGGDEFGILLLNCNLDTGKTIARKLLDMINHYRFLWNEHQFDIGASIGVVEINENSESIITVLGNADIASYAAKDAGRNQIKIYNSEDSESVQRYSDLQLASQIPKALSDNRFKLMVQTIAPLREISGMNPHYEILLRMIDDDNNLIPPGVFIPAAERYNLMPAIDFWVVVHVFEFLNEFAKHNGRDEIPSLAINLSGESMGSEELLAYIRAQFELGKIPAENICFEITETSAISNLSKAIEFINSLKHVGCKFSLDDFGSGLSSFSYLKSLPVDYLKIDGIFVKDILTDPIDAAMVDSINQIGHIMNIETIAEFVENAEIMDMLILLGVDYAQGYHIDKPTPLNEKFPITKNLKLKKTG